MEILRCSYKHRHFEKLLAGNDHVLDIFIREYMENISLCILVFYCLLYNKLMYSCSAYSITNTEIMSHYLSLRS